MGLLRFVLAGVILPLGLVSAGAAALAHGGRFSQRLDVLTHFAPLYLAVGVVVLVAAIFAERRPMIAVLGAVAVVASLALMAPELLRGRSATAPAGAAGQIKVIQFNAGQASDRLEARLAWLAKEDPDVLVVEDSLPVFQTALTHRLGRHMACGRTCEVAIFTREAPALIESPRRGRYGLGPAVAVAHVDHPAGAFAVVGTHYVWPIYLRTHRENGARLLQIVQPMAKDRLILAGDFNSTPWSFARRREDAALGIERRTHALPTWPANGAFGLAFLPIDHLYAGRGWRTVSVRRGPRLGSDHYPVVAVLAPS